MCTTSLSRAVRSSLSTSIISAAAPTSISRADAPIRRIVPMFRGTEVDPPDIWKPNFSSRGASRTLTSSHRAPISSATIIGRVVLIPWPISGMLE